MCVRPLASLRVTLGEIRDTANTRTSHGVRLVRLESSDEMPECICWQLGGLGQQESVCVFQVTGPAMIHLVRFLDWFLRVVFTEVSISGIVQVRMSATGLYFDTVAMVQLVPDSDGVDVGFLLTPWMDRTRGQRTFWFFVGVQWRVSSDISGFLRKGMISQPRIVQLSTTTAPNLYTLNVLPRSRGCFPVVVRR